MNPINEFLIYAAVFAAGALCAFLGRWVQYGARLDRIQAALRGHERREQEMKAKIARELARITQQAAQNSIEQFRLGMETGKCIQSRAYRAGTESNSQN